MISYLPGTQKLIKLHYYWPTLNRKVDDYVKRCDWCARVKVGRNPMAPLRELPEKNCTLSDDVY
jgi:hypothetical protein